MQAAFAVCIDTGRENGGGFQRGTIPLWHTTFGESLVCYTFCPGWRGKGAARSGADAFPHQKISLRNGASAIISRADFGRGERYIKPPSLVLRPAAAVLVLLGAHPPGYAKGSVQLSPVSSPPGSDSNADSNPPRRAPAPSSLNPALPTV